MNPAILLAAPLGSVALVVFGAFYVLPTLLALADAYGRPAHEWRAPGRRTFWIVVLAVSFPLAVFGAAQAVALVYAFVVPRRAWSPEAAAGAVAARARATRALLIGFVVFGGVFVLTLPSGSNDVLFSILGTSAVLLALGVGALLFGGGAAPSARRAQVILIVVVSFVAGWVVHYGTVDTCWEGRWCRNPYALWIPVAHVAAGGLAAWWVTRRKEPEPEPA